MNERLNLTDFIKKRKITQKELGDIIKVKPQLISRAILHPNKTRHILPPAIKYGLLKYLDFDVEEGVTEFHKTFIIKEESTKVSKNSSVEIQRDLDECKVINISIRL